MTERSIIIACRPVHLDLTVAIDRLMEQHTPIYTGAVEQACELCEELVYVGPRQQQKLLEEDASVMCLRCVVMLNHSAQPGDSMEIRSLDNPEGSI